MTTMKRSALALSAAALLALSLSACGNNASGAPKDASMSDFCAAYNSDQSFAGLASTDYDGAADAAHQMASKMKDVGTPSNIPSDARDGFELMVQAMEGMTADKLKTAMTAMQKSFSNSTDAPDPDTVANQMLGISSSDAPKLAAFTKWAGDNC
ncbi:MAG TPA: hypothetical protein VN088_03695 [Nocardioides sp.]|nr:hypothetical protein [Nocardioides sp.]